MITLPATLSTPTAGSVLADWCGPCERFRFDEWEPGVVFGLFGEAADVYLIGQGRTRRTLLDHIRLDPNREEVRDHLLRWLGRHYGIDVGIGCPGWTYHHDEHGGWYRLRGVGGEVVFFSTGHPASGTTKAGATWVTLPALPTNPLEALAAACLYAAGVPRE